MCTGSLHSTQAFYGVECVSAMRGTLDCDAPPGKHDITPCLVLQIRILSESTAEEIQFMKVGKDVRPECHLLKTINDHNFLKDYQWL